MPHTAAWNEASPAGSDPVSSVDNYIREMKRDIRERMSAEHVWNDSTSTDGNHSTAFWNKVWPVGSIYTSVVSTNPNTLMGFGTWTAFAAGRVLVGIDAGQTEFDTVEETGGAKEITLTENQIPAHDHTITDPGHTHGIGDVVSGTGLAAGADFENVAATSVSNTTGITVDNAGGGQPHSNLQPYIVVYMWKRTA